MLMEQPDEAQLKAEIEKIASRIDKIVKVVKQYYPESNEAEDTNDSDAAEKENQPSMTLSSDQEA
mgnify:CR=1 FL=1